LCFFFQINFHWIKIYKDSCLLYLHVISMMTDVHDALEKFTDIFERKNRNEIINDSIDVECFRQLAGRVTRGLKEEHFTYLQKNRTVKKFAWVMGADGLILFLREPSNLQVLHSLGFEDVWIRKRLEDGEKFRLGIFPQSDQCVPATWDGIMTLIDRYYSNNISNKVRQHIETLKQMTYDEIEARARLSYLNGASYFDVNELAIDGCSNDPRFMSDERFAECKGTLEQTRGFLYNRLGLSAFYDGSGFTKDKHGQLAVREYMQLNIPVRDISGFRYLNLPIDDNELTPDV